MAGGGIPIGAPTLATGFLKGRELIFPLSLVISLFFLWGFSYGLLDVLNKHFQVVLDITKLQSTGLQVVYFGGGYLLFSPIAAEVMKRKGYKVTILMGLSLYSLGAIFFWPTAHFSTYAHRIASFGGFCACTLVIACGLATLDEFSLYIFVQDEASSPDVDPRPPRSSPLAHLIKQDYGDYGYYGYYGDYGDYGDYRDCRDYRDYRDYHASGFPQTSLG